MKVSENAPVAIGYFLVCVAQGADGEAIYFQRPYGDSHKWRKYREVDYVSYVDDYDDVNASFPVVELTDEDIPDVNGNPQGYSLTKIYSEPAHVYYFSPSGGEAFVQTATSTTPSVNRDTTGPVVDDTPGNTPGTVDVPSQNPPIVYNPPVTNPVITPITQPTSIAGAALVLSQTSFKYNGKTQVPTIKLVGGKFLVPGIDYTTVVSKPASKAAGTYTITAVGKGNYVGTSASATYKIKEAKITAATFSKIKAQKYKKGKAVKPSVTIKYAGKKLKKGTDYTLKYKGNKKKGSARVIVTGKGNFTGSKSLVFKIK